MRDVIVVGAGPVGSQLARRFSEKGLDVAVIERSSEIGKPLACSGHVSPDIWDFVPDGERDRLYQNEINGARFHPDRDSKYRFYRKGEPVSYVIDRVELDRVKAEQARESGADYFLGEEVQKVEEREDCVAVETGEDSYTAEMVAGCDGASSTVRSELGMPEPDHFYQGILCFTDEDDSSDFVDVFTGVPEFFGWRIPRGDSVEYGAAVPRGESPRKWLKEITGRYVEDRERRNFCAGAIPIGPPDSVTSERVFLVGDAAAQTKPFTGGGILYGMRSADTAAETIDPSHPSTLKLYEEEWRAELLDEIRLGKLIERSYSWPTTVQKTGMSLFQGEIGVHMDRPTTLFSLDQLRSLFRR
ncbi:MAG: geranylgeranyl reductase family protein [Candidatus Nanohaloarchaea archaeon]